MEDSRISSRIIFHFFLSYFFLSCLRMHAQILRNLFPNIQLPRWDVVLLLLLLLLFTWYLSKHMEFHTLLWWTEWGVTQSVSFVIILKNNCTGRSSSTVHLFTKFNWEPSGIFLLLLLQRKREGVTSPIRQVFYNNVVFGLLFLFEIIAHSLVVTS